MNRPTRRLERTADAAAQPGTRWATQLIIHRGERLWTGGKSVRYSRLELL